MEICINSAWGTICNDLFDDIDAGVACQQLGGFERESELCRPTVGVEGAGGLSLIFLILT